VTRYFAGVATLAVALFFSACGGDTNSPSQADALPMDRDQLAKYVQAHLENKANFGHISSVACEAGLADREGSVTNCSLVLAYGFEEPVKVTADRDASGNLIPGLSYVSRSSG
jgi:hypothetical protein